MPQFSSRCLVKPLVSGIKRGYGNIDDSESTDKSVTAPRFYEDRSHRLYRNPITIQFDESLALQNEINLGGKPMIVRAGVQGYFHKMEGGERIIGGSKASLRLSAWARKRRQGIQLRHHVPLGTFGCGDGRGSRHFAIFHRHYSVGSQSWSDATGFIWLG